MKIAFTYLDNQPKIQRQNNQVVFGAGLTHQIAKKIQEADIAKITEGFVKRGIKVDFKDSKVVAWCCEKTANIFQELNERFNLKLTLPEGIFVEDFEKLNVDNPTMHGFCNWLPTKLIKNSNEEIAGKTLFFNSFESILAKASPEQKWVYDWENIDKIADIDFASGFKSTDHFLEFFLNEFSHAAHEGELLKKFRWKRVAKKIQQTRNRQQMEIFQNKYSQKLSEICDYASNDQFEAVACDMSKKVADSLDLTTLTPKTNPFLHTPYEKLPLVQRINLIIQRKKNDLSVQDILRNFWNGKFN